MLKCSYHNYNDVIMSAMAYQITSLKIVYSIIHSGADQRKHQSSASLDFVRGIHRSPVNSPHKGPATRKMFPVDDVFMALKLAGASGAVCQISEQLNNSNHRSRAFGTLWNLTIKRLLWYWIAPSVLKISVGLVSIRQRATHLINE